MLNSSVLPSWKKISEGDEIMRWTTMTWWLEQGTMNPLMTHQEFHEVRLASVGSCYCLMYLFINGRLEKKTMKRAEQDHFLMEDVINHRQFIFWYVISFSSEFEPFFFGRDFGGTRRGTLLGTKISHQKSQKKMIFRTSQGGICDRFLEGITLPKTNSSPPENRPSQQKTSIPTIRFQVRTASFREGIYGMEGLQYNSIWAFPQMVVPPKHPRMIILVGKPMVVGYHHFRKPPYSKLCCELDREARKAPLPCHLKPARFTPALATSKWTFQLSPRWTWRCGGGRTRGGAGILVCYRTYLKKVTYIII